MQTARNVAIIALLAFFVAAVPGGGETAAVVGAILSMAFLSVIAWALYRFYVDREMTLLGMTDGQRAVVYGAVGAVALLIVGYEEFQSWSGGTLVWIMLMAGAIAAAFFTWRSATTYS
jgi:hypothetical protein